MQTDAETPQRPASGPGSPVGVRSARLMLFAPAAVALIMGLAAGLQRLGVLGEGTSLEAVHAPAMLFGFVGSLVVLERAVAIRRGWAFFAPLLLSLGSLSLLTPMPTLVGQSMVGLGFVVMLLIYRVIWGRQNAVATSIQALAAGLGLVSAVLWAAGIPFDRLSPIAALFLVITIVGERVELGRVGGLTARGEAGALALSVAVAVFAVTTLVWADAGYILLGISAGALVLWLLVVDVARITIASTGAARYMAVCLLCGYGWLLVAAAVWLLVGRPTGVSYDAVTHAVLLGFVMSMIMAHASVILPAVLRISLPYTPVFYIAVALLQISLAVRVLGDVRAIDPLVQVGGVGNVVAVVLFLMTALGSAVGASARGQSRGRSPDQSQGRPEGRAAEARAGGPQRASADAAPSSPDEARKEKAPKQKTKRDAASPRGSATTGLSLSVGPPTKQKGDDA